MNQEKSKNERKADFETSRLFIEQICHFRPIILTRNYASQLE